MGNFSRDTFDLNKLKHYVNVRLQQGVPIVDADWNEMDDIHKFELQAFLKWYIGNGVPVEKKNSFKIEPSIFRISGRGSVSLLDDFLILGGDGSRIDAGRCLVDGWDVMIPNTLKYTSQELYDNEQLAAKWGVPKLEKIKFERRSIYHLYLDIWEQETDSNHDNNLINPVIGIETCVRIERKWVVRVAVNDNKPLNLVKHVYYPLALITLDVNEKNPNPLIITDLRNIIPSFSNIAQEIISARGTRESLKNRLDKSLMDNGELKFNVVGNDQVKSDAGVAESKINFSDINGHNHSGGKNGVQINTQSIAPNAINLSRININPQIKSGSITLQLGQYIDIKFENIKIDSDNIGLFKPLIKITKINADFEGPIGINYQDGTVSLLTEILYQGTKIRKRKETVGVGTGIPGTVGVGTSIPGTIGVATGITGIGEGSGLQFITSYETIPIIRVTVKEIEGLKHEHEVEFDCYLIQVN